MVTTMLPELAVGLHTSLATAATSLTAYLLPFAAIMLVSGTLAQRWGRERSVRVAYLAYALTSLGCVLAPNATWFLLARAGQGAANAFTTPLLVAMLADRVAPLSLGRALGRFGGLQAAGWAFAPLVGGLAAAIDYRWAFAAAALAAAALGILTATGRRASAEDLVPDDATSVVPPARWRALANRQLALASLVAFGLYLSTSGLTVLATLLAHDRLSLAPQTRGLVIAALGVAGLLTGSRLGRVADHVGLVRFGLMVSWVLAVTVAAAGWVASTFALVVAMSVAGAASTAGRLTSTGLALSSTPANRAGATSVALACQFLGSAVAPVLLLPIYHRTVELSFVAASCGALLAAALLATGRRATSG